MKVSTEERQHELETFVAVVTARYVETGRDLTVPEIAEALGWTESKVRRLLAAQGGCPNGLVSVRDERPSYSRNYRGMQSGTHRIWIYGPTRETLRQQLRLRLAMAAQVRS